jgi:hypothetical protein
VNLHARHLTPSGETSGIVVVARRAHSRADRVEVLLWFGVLALGLAFAAWSFVNGPTTTIQDDSDAPIGGPARGGDG